MKEGKNMKDLTQELTERFYRYIDVPSQYKRAVGHG